MEGFNGDVPFGAERYMISYSQHIVWLRVSAFCFHLLEKKASLMMTEEATDL